MVKNHPLTNVRIVKIMMKNLEFRGQFSTFEIEYISSCGSVKSKNNALTLPEQLLNNFGKVPKFIKNCQNWPRFVAVANLAIRPEKSEYYSFSMYVAAKYKNSIIIEF